jgi:hypothetical protein
VLVFAAAGANSVFKSESGFKITYPTRCKIDHNETTLVKFYVYLSENTPVDAVTVSTDDSFDSYATLNTVTERYADAITSAYKELKVLSK